jgi:AcrR family transcriptional regulator
MSTEVPPGRRERKKAATRQALSDAALRLFLERGFDDVTVREIADAADVSTTTLMKHFATKEALVFDRDDELERGLIAAVAERPARTSALDGLRAYMRARVARVVPDRVTEFMKLVRTTPALSEYWQKMWMRHEHALARGLAADLGRPEGDLWCAAMAHFVLAAAAQSERSRQAARMIEVAFEILEHGWQRSAAASAASPRPRKPEPPARRATARAPLGRNRASGHRRRGRPPFTAA